MLIFLPVPVISKARDSKKYGYLVGRCGDVAREVELSSGSRRVAGSIPPWACRSVPEQDT